ncbi:hypothetical protein KZZ52_28590 [Dactylosporangium sp. AC04546]|uniref:CBU_0592 family membrane protein n=1 Tax=Dactylosporangium sp. AC04546 TaxID=2862460 RepID=UPI001EE0723A|nr:hypothetical protein [Dactylosporangium sp. AC04546]WVK89228.1 hypothetical protein KZZ52_28590 [Dactylosporangium sp. AC04546]
MLEAVVIQLAGSLLILLPFVLVQLGRLETRSQWYNVLNLVGSGILAVEALHGRQWGFLLLEGVWALVSLRAVLWPRGHRPGHGATQREAAKTDA